MGEPGPRGTGGGRPDRPTAEQAAVPVGEPPTDQPTSHPAEPPRDQPAEAPTRPEQRPAEVDLYRTVVVGTIAWVVVVLVLLPFVGRLANADRGWWLQTAIAGVLLGLVGMVYARRRR